MSGLNKNFLHPNIRSFELSRFRFITGIIIGISYAIIFYSLLNLSREVFILFSVTKEFDFWHFTDREIKFYNLIFAFIAVIIGQSQCISFWLNTPRRSFDRIHRRKVTIVNDQKVLNWSFLSWFFRLASLYGILFSLFINGGYYVFSFYPHYNYVFILILPVLYFQTWNTIRLTFKNKSLKWLMISIVLVTGMSFGLSRINFVDHKKIDKEFSHKSIYYKYDLEIPKTNVFKQDRGTLTKDIYVVTSRNDTNNSHPLIIVNNKKIKLSELCHVLDEWRNKMTGQDAYRTSVRLHIHSKVRMKFVNRLKTVLSNCGISKIGYAVLPVDPTYDIRYYNDLSLFIYIPNFRFGLYTFQEYYKSIYRFDHSTIKIEVSDDGKYFVNNSLTASYNLKDVIKRQIVKHPVYSIRYIINDNVDFASYLKVISSSKEAVNEFRNEYSLKKYGKKYNTLADWSSKKKEADSIYPYVLYEFTQDEIKTLKTKK